MKSSAQLQLVNKALSAPQAVIQNLAGSNGQDCFQYTGKCVDLNDNDAMAAACGSGYTVIGWDDAGCGKKKCVSGWNEPQRYPSLSHASANVYVFSIVANQFAALSTAPPKTVSGEAITIAKVHRPTAVPNAFPERSTSQVSSLRGVVASSMMVTRTSVVVERNHSVVRIRTLFR